MEIKEKVVEIINNVNPKLERLAGARMDLVKVDDKKSEIFIKVEAKKNSC